MSRASRVAFAPLLIAVAALVATLATIAPEGNGPGVTCDEAYHVNRGKELVTALRQQGLAFFQRANVQRNFGWQPGDPPLQAPLGHWILGWTHWLMDPAPDDPSVISLTSARFAPAAAFALLVLMVGWWTARREGALAGAVAAAAVALMPRLFAHAHLASLDMLTTVFFVAAVLAVTEAARGGRWWHFALAGTVWGAAVLVRLHGLLVAPPVLLWLVWHFWRQSRGTEVAVGKTIANPGVLLRQPPPSPAVLWPFLRAAAAWLAAGGGTVLLGWPWLWRHTIERFLQYVLSGSVRQPLHVFYWGRVWADRDVPWHYPWVIFAVTVPVGLLALGLVGLWAGFGRRSADNVPSGMVRGGMGKRSLPVRSSAETTSPPRVSFAYPCHPAAEEYILLAAAMLFVLGVFSWLGTPVYDGERLFLMAFPFWAVWVGVGARRLRDCPCWGGSCTAIADRPRKRAAEQRPPQRRFLTADSAKTAAVLVFVALQGIGLLLYHPCQLSYYNLLVGGLAGAEKRGFEVTYWGDTIREPMLAEAARLSPDEPILFAPSLAPFQAPAVEISSPALRTAGQRLIGWDQSAANESARRCRYAVIYHRRADLAEAAPLMERGRVVMESTLQGVWVARLIELRPPRRTRPME